MEAAETALVAWVFAFGIVLGVKRPWKRPNGDMMGAHSGDLNKLRIITPFYPKSINLDQAGKEEQRKRLHS